MGERGKVSPYAYICHREGPASPSRTSRPAFSAQKPSLESTLESPLKSLESPPEQVADLHVAREPVHEVNPTVEVTEGGKDVIISICFDRGMVGVKVDQFELDLSDTELR